MTGRAKALKYQRERDLRLAYETGAFSRASKVKPLQHYLDKLRGPEKADSSSHYRALHFFRSLQANGLPVSIERSKIEGR